MIHEQNEKSMLMEYNDFNQNTKVRRPLQRPYSSYANRNMSKNKSIILITETESSSENSEFFQ